jgi:hypothetical protein
MITFMFKKNFRILCTVILMAACSTPPVGLKEVIDDSDRTIFLLNYEILKKGDPEWKGICSIAITELASGSVYTLNMDSSKKMIQVEAPAGAYRIGTLSCGRSDHWDLGNFGAISIQAYPGKVNYLGRFVFRLSVEKEIHRLSLDRGNRDETRKSLAQTAHNMSPRWRSRVVSAYNGGALEASYLENERNYHRGTTSHVVGKKVDLKSMKFDECEKTEIQTNPVPLGMLSYKVVYNQDQFVEMQRVKDIHSFSNSYIECVEGVLKSFKPVYSGQVEYDVNF